MFIYLAESGSEAFFPEGTEVIDYTTTEVAVVARAGRLIATFARKDLALYSSYPLPSPQVAMSG